MNISNAGLITANAGVSVVNSTADIRGEARTGSHATPVGLYVTGNLGSSSGGVEFRHSNGTQGIGFGYNSIYATGSNTNQDLNFYARGTGLIYAQNDLVVGANKKLCIDRKNATTNKLVIYDYDTNSATEFQGFGTGNGIFIYNVPTGNSHVFYDGATTELLRINSIAITASKSITANAGIIYSGVLTTASASANGAKICIQGATDGTNARGIFMWDIGDSNWGIYMGTSGAGKSLSGGSAPAALNNDFTGHAIRFRVNNSSTNGFIWENASNACKMSLRADNGQLVVPLNVYVTSDKRLKTDIKECLGLELINRINPVCFCMIENKTPLRMGMLAQELDDILQELNIPDFAGLSKTSIKFPCEKQGEECKMKGLKIKPEDVKMVENGDYSYSIAYPEFIAPLIKSVQQLSEKINNLEKENKHLMSILQDQANQLAEIRAVVFLNVQQ